MPSSLHTSAFHNYPYGYKYNVSSISGLDFRIVNSPSGGADPLTGKLYSEIFNTTQTSSENGTSPFFSGLSVLDQYGAGMNVFKTFTGLTGVAVSAGGKDTYMPEASRYYKATTAQIPYPDGLPYSPSVSAVSPGNFFGRLSYENTGPFRLYLEPDPFAHRLRYLNCSSLSDNRLYQTFSQGYFASGAMSATDFDLSTWDLTKGVIQVTGGITKSVPAAGALYIGAEDIVRPENYNIRLDESAAHMFANAKHCSTEFLGRPKMVDIYKSGYNTTGGSLNGDAPENMGAGFKSPHTFDLRRRY